MAGPLDPDIAEAIAWLDGAAELEAICFHDFLCLKFPPREPLLFPWLCKGDLAMIYAWRGLGKTFLALAIALAVATGSELLGWKANAARRVLYVDGEMRAVELQSRLKRLSEGMKVEPLPNMLNILSADCLEGLPDLSAWLGHKKFLTLVAGTDLVIFDNLSALCHEGVENEAESWTPIQRLARVLRHWGIAVLFIHHSSKNGNQRGTSRKEDALDVVIKLERPSCYQSSQGSRIEVRFEKARTLTGPDLEPLVATLTAGEDGSFSWRREPAGDPMRQKAIELQSQNMTQREIAAQLGISLGKVNRLLKS